MRLFYSSFTQSWFLMWNDTVIRVGPKEEIRGWCKGLGITLKK